MSEVQIILQKLEKEYGEELMRNLYIKRASMLHTINFKGYLKQCVMAIESRVNVATDILDKLLALDELQKFLLQDNIEEARALIFNAERSYYIKKRSWSEINYVVPEQEILVCMLELLSIDHQKILSTSLVRHC